MTGAHQWEANAAVKSGGRNRFWKRTAKYKQIDSAKGGNFIVMDIALAIVDILAGNQHPPARKNRTDWKCWKCGLTAGKERNYQRNSKRKLRRFVPANRVYYIQSAYPFQ